jgi:urease alpha subunit
MDSAVQKGRVGMTAQTTKQRQDALKARRAAEGLKELRSLYCHPEDNARVRAYVARLNAQRRKAR